MKNNTLLFLFLVALSSTLTTFVAIPSAQATPLYTARSGRTCNNCHTEPKGWNNPELKMRKCTLSCQGCHTDPTGGGARNVSGVFYAKSTLVWHSPFYEPKPHHNYEYSKRSPEKAVRQDPKKVDNFVSPNEPATDLAFGKPIGGSAEMSFDQDRYNNLNADPLVRFSADLRFAFWTPAQAVFPMQVDTNVTLTPMAHLTTYVNAGVLGKARGFDETLDREKNYKVKDAFVMLHQFPYLAYIRAGAFLPPFGTRLDDHTSSIRRDFELNQSITNSRVTGVEFGAAPNYPYINVAVFRPNRRDTLYDGEADRDINPDAFDGDGSGVAGSLGWRDVGGGIGASYMAKRRTLENGGNTNSTSVQWYFNPYFFWADIPLTYMGEIAWGDRQRDISGTVHEQKATYHELAYLYAKWLNLRLKYDFSDSDVKLKSDEETRFSLGVDYNFATGMSLSLWLRNAKSTMGDGSALSDGILILRMYL